MTDIENKSHLSTFSRFKLGNRAVLLTEHLPYARTAAVGLWIGFGARCESAQTLGAAHFIEHMLFKGAAGMDPMDIAVAFESVGASFNAAASKEVTRLYSRVLTEHIPLALQLLSDMALRSSFPQEEFDREVQVVLEEIKSVMDVPEDIVHDIFFEDFYPGHGLGNNVLGTEESIEGITRDALYGVYSNAYRPAHFIVAVAGNLGDHDLPAAAERALGPDSADPCRFLHTPPAPASTPPSIHLEPRDSNLVQFCFGFPGIPYDSEDQYSCAALDMVLSGGMSSRLFQEVREKRGLVYDISTENVNYSDSGVFYVNAGARKENLAEVLEITVGELVKVRNGETSADELHRVKEQYRAGMVMSCENVVARMSRLARNEMYFGRDVPDEEILEGIRGVTPEAVAAVARKYLRGERLVFTGLGPFEDGESEEIRARLVDVFEKL